MDVLDRSDRPDVLGGLNPALRVPTLVLDDGRALGESGAILCFLAEGTPFLPDDRCERAQVLQWLFFEQYDLEPNIAVARFWLAVSGTPERWAAELPAKQEAGYRTLAAMERHLAEHSSWSASATRWPTSRSTATRTWPRRAGSSWAGSRRSRPGWHGWRAARAHPDRRVNVNQAVRRRRVAAPSASDSAVAPTRITASRHTSPVTVDEAATRDSAS